MQIQDKVVWDAGAEGKLATLGALGLDCVAIDLPDGPGRNPLMDFSTPDAAVKTLLDIKARVAAHGMQLKTVQATNGFEKIKRGLPGRDEQIQWIINALEAMGELGVTVMAYNFKLLLSKYLRSAPARGRGGAEYIAFDYEAYLRNPAPAENPPIGEQQMLDNLRYYLAAILPAAEKAGVRLALHPDDPPMPKGLPPLAGAAHIASSFDDYRRIFDLVPSRSNGMLFCQGCVKEMQGVDVYAGIREMGSIDKIVMVHFRNVRGSFPKFEETFVDNGEVDMFRAMQAYRDVGFKGPFSLDHSPHFPGEEIANQAFVIGYMRALIQAVYR